MFRFAIVVQRIGLVLAILLALAAGGLAQQAPLVGIDPIRASLDQIEAAARRGASVRTLYDLQQALGPLRDGLQAKLADLEPRLADVDTRLRGLGPAASGGTEDAAIAAERTRLTQLRGELDSALKQARLLQTRADQLAAAISDRRRAAYAETVFERSPSVLDPSFWHDVATAVPVAFRSTSAVAQEAAAYARGTGGLLRLAIALVALAVFAAGMIALAQWWKQRLAARASGEARYSPPIASLLVFIRTGFAMPLTIVVATELIDQIGLMSKALSQISAELVAGVFFASLGRAAALGVFAPNEPQRRILDVGDANARSFARHLIWGSRALGLLVFLLGVHKTSGTMQLQATAASMLFSAAVLVLVLHLLFETRPREVDFDAVPRRRTLWVRPIAWIAVAAITVALLAGYIGLATFVAGRTIFTVILLGVLYLLLTAGDRAIGEVLSAESPRTRLFAANLGLDPRRLGLLGVVLSGVVRVLFVLIAIALAIGPWEIVAGDFYETARRAVFGIRIGDISISFAAVFSAIVMFAIVLVLTRISQRWLESRLLPNTRVEPSLQLSIVTVFGYVGFIIALVAALAELGIDPQKIALVAGALSVGIGFGLQSIVSNFVSGLILLAERPIRVGDQIVVKNEEGFVRRISVRATEIETFDKASVIIPNSELITGVVKNWTHANTMGRVHFQIGVSYDSDPEQVRDILTACVTEHPAIIKEPPPAVFLMEFGDNALNFEIFCIATDLSKRGLAKSEINIEILKRFRAAGIEIPFPQRDVRLIGTQGQPAEGKSS